VDANRRAKLGFAQQTTEEPIAAAPEPVRAEIAPEPPAPAPRPAAAPAPPAAAQEIETIISQPAVSAAAGSLTRLASQLRIAEHQGQTLEAVVRELLKPMLKEWLDRNLPAIVESRVEAELERIARLAR
jgi:cell pole-organizing protein PopZ